MGETRKVVRVFLASPGDLKEERIAAKSAVDEINALLAHSIGYDVELVGWEDTISATGRPQALINQELATCELFIGMMWRRWGTTPDLEGHYSSGFEEEFETSVKRQRTAGSPEIKLLFKEVDEALLNDPGPDLVKVTEFKMRIIKEKRILFQTFANERDLERKIRACVAQHLAKLQSQDRAVAASEDKSTKEDQRSNTALSNPETPSSPSARSHSFLAEFAGKTERYQQNKISPIEIARVRLIGNAISKWGNHESYLGTHDSNILFAARDVLDLDGFELRGLVDFGLKSFRSESMPLWFWLKEVEQRKSEYLVFSSARAPTDAERVGAISAMELIRLSPGDAAGFNKTFLLSHWFADETADDVRVAALQYLATCGTAADLDCIREELSRSSSRTTRAAIEALLSITFRYDRAQALQELVWQSFESIDVTLLGQVLGELKHAKTDLLLAGLEHRCPRVREACIRETSERSALPHSLAEKLLNDPEAAVRYEALKALIALGNTFTESAARAALVRPRKSRGLAQFWSDRATDEEGEECLEEYRFRHFSSFKEKELEKIFAATDFYDTVIYFALCKRYFQRWAGDLRKNVDDRFSSYFERKFEAAERSTGGVPDDFRRRIRDLEDWLRRKLMRAGLDVLCDRGEERDLERIRANLRSGYASPSNSDIRYLERMGRWEDLELIFIAAIPSYKSGLLGSRRDVETSKLAAAAICRIAKERLPEALQLKMSDELKNQTILHCSDREFSRLSRSAVLSLLNSGNDSIRRSAALKCLRTLSQKETRELLSAYMGQDSRYYNVIHWLDLGISRERSTVKIASAAAIQRAMA